MIEDLLLFLFAGSAVAAGSAIVSTVLRYGPAALALRSRMQSCSQHQACSYRLQEFVVGPVAVPAGQRRKAHRAAPAGRQPVRRPALRAAA